MQENVKVFTPEVLVEIFGDVKPKGDFNYKLLVPHINSRELAQLAKVNEDYEMNFHIKRSDKGLMIYSPSIPDNPKTIDEELSELAGIVSEFIKRHYTPM